MAEQKLGAPLFGDHSESGGAKSAKAGAERSTFRVAATAEKSLNTIRPGLFPIACLRFDDTHFASGTSFVLPSSRPSLHLLHEMLAEREGSPISLFAHADPTGDDDRNKQWSGRRALALLGVLAHRVDIWETLYDGPMEGDSWGVPMIQLVLRVLPKGGTSGGRDEPYFKGDFSFDLTEETREALAAFQADEAVGTGGELDSATRQRLFQRYFEYLTRPPGGEAAVLGPERFLGRLADPDYRVDVQGCSEHNPVLVFSEAEQNFFDAQGHEVQRGAENAANRRVLVLIFPKGAEVTAAEWPCPRAVDGSATCRSRFWSDGLNRISPGNERRLFESTRDTMACRFYHRFVDKSPCERTVKLVGLHLRILDAEGAPRKLVPYRLVVGDLVFEGLTGKDGGLVHAIPADATSGKLTMNGFERTLVIGPVVDAEDDVGSSMRLQNLAFGSGGPGALSDKPSAVERFLSAMSLPTAKTLSAKAIQALRDRYGA